MRTLLLILALVAVPVQAVTLRWAAQNDILTLDPHSQNHATTHAMMQYAYEGLTRYTKNYQIEPCLAVSWEQLSDTHWRFKLRQGVKFHDGSPFTADDVVFSFGRIKQPQGTNQVYVINGSSVVVFDGASGDEKGSIRFTEPLYAVAVDPVTSRLYATSADTLFETSLNPQLTEMKSFQVGNYAVGLAVNPTTNMVYAANYISNTVSVLDATKESIVGTIDLGAQSTNPSELAVNPITNKVYVTTGRNSIVVIDGSTDRVTTTLRVGTSPSKNATYALAVDPTKNQVYVASTPSPLLTIIDGGTDTVAGTLRINYSPYELAVNPANSRLYVTDYHLLTVVEVGDLSSSQHNTALELSGAIALAILLAAVLVWRRSRRRLVSDKTGREIIPTGEKPDVLLSRLRRFPSYWPSSRRRPR